MYKDYSIYKESGVEWPKDIPSNWQMLKLGRIGRFSASGIDKKSDPDEMPVRMVNYTDVYGNHSLEISSSDCLMETTTIAEKIAEHSLKQGDILFTPSSETEEDIGVSVVVTKNLDKTVYSYHLIRFRTYICFELVLGFCKYFCNSHEVLSQFSRLCKGTTRQILGRDDFKSVQVVLPPAGEQKTIASFLDRKIAQIDGLISKKERMIELLKEERIAIINQAVTQGLNLKAEMKDSGIEWLGNMPKHWEIKKLKFNALVQFSNVNKKSEDGESSVRLCNYVDVYYNDFITPDLEFMEATASSEEIKKFHLKVGDVLLTKDSEEWNDIAIPAYMTFEAPDLICGYHLAQVRPQDEVILGKYLFWLLSADCINYQFRIEASGVTRYGLGNYALSNSMCLIPPKREQEAIATFLDKKTAQLDEQVTRAQKSIELLKEYRTSLISEVVTGKIDVRGEVNV